MSTLYNFIAYGTVTVYDVNDKPITHVVRLFPIAGLVAVIIIDLLTCALILYWFITTIYIPIIRTYLAIVLTDMGDVASFTEMFIVGFTTTTSMCTTVLLRDLSPVYGPGGTFTANVMTLIETAWTLIFRAN